MAGPLTIQIIDDSLEDRETYKKYLASINENKPLFLECETGEEGLELLKNEKVDCIILDYHLPDTDGIELLSELSQKNDFRIPVIFLTGQGSEMVAVQAMKTGAMDYLIKTNMTQELLNRSVQYAVEKQATDLKLEAYVNELERATQKIIEQQKEIIEEERLKVILEMAGATAHELNQPLMVLLNGIELMEVDQDTPEEFEKHLSMVKDAGKKIANIVKKIQRVRHYETRPYAGGSEIVNLDQALNILIVEDLDEDHDQLIAALACLDQTATFKAEDLDQGFQILDKESIDIIFLDYFLPSGTALDFITRMREKEIDTPVIVTTASGDEMVASKTIQAGAYDYVPKSKINRESVREVIQNALSRFRVRQETSLAMQKMAQMATYDELTGLYNRRYFNAYLAGEIERCKRFKSGFSLFLTDVDYFKKVNDTDGHPAGDLVLRQAANILKGCLRTSDVPCRFGGDEFIVILPNATDEDCRKICERFRKNLAREEIVWEDQTIHVTVSIGVTSFAGQQADNAQALIQKADEALYRAKKKGRNQVC